MIKVGCCGFPCARKEYHKNFEVVEVQKTFYKPPQLETLERWKSEANENFEFTLKAWQLITHPPTSSTYRKANLLIRKERQDRYGFFRQTKEVFKAWKEVEKAAKTLKATFILFQCPPSFSETPENQRNLEEFFCSIGKPCKFGLELRGRWNSSILEKLVTKLDLIHVVDPFKSKAIKGELSYYRLHGITGYRHNYSPQELAKLKSFCDPSRLTYVLFNNTQMLKNALEFKSLVEQP
jgi:uncharacterized protein YecE (DUF72 family)